MISSYRQLDIWKKSVELVTEIYNLSSTFPKAEIFGLTAQIRRAAISIPSNIAEGWGRKLTKEFIQFPRVARGSLLELETQLIISQNLGYLENQIVEALMLRTQEINKMINGLIISLGKK